MKIQLDKIIMNRTARYLKPCLRYYGTEFINKLSSVFKLAYGIGDMYINKVYEKHIFILIDTQRCKDYWLEFIEYFVNEDFYEDDYAVDHLENGRLHMIVIKLPENCLSKKDDFLKGRYSKMYTQEEIKTLLDEQTTAIVIRDSNYKISFVKQVNEYFGTHLKESDLKEDSEYDIPPNIDDKESFENIIS